MDLYSSRYDSQKFLHLFSKLSLKNSKKDEELNIKYLSYLTNSGKYTDPDEPLALQVDISTLSKPVKKFLYKYDCDVTPMCENQLEYFEEIEFFDRLWGMEHIESPSLVPRKLILLLLCHHGLMNQILQLQRAPPKRQ